MITQPHAPPQQAVHPQHTASRQTSAGTPTGQPEGWPNPPRTHADDPHPPQPPATTEDNPPNTPGHLLLPIVRHIPPIPRQPPVSRGPSVHHHERLPTAAVPPRHQRHPAPTSPTRPATTRTRHTTRPHQPTRPSAPPGECHRPDITEPGVVGVVVLGLVCGWCCVRRCCWVGWLSGFRRVAPGGVCGRVLRAAAARSLPLAVLRLPGVGGRLRRGRLRRPFTTWPTRRVGGCSGVVTSVTAGVGPTCCGSGSLFNRADPRRGRKRAHPVASGKVDAAGPRSPRTTPGGFVGFGLVGGGWCASASSRLVRLAHTRKLVMGGSPDAAVDPPVRPPRSS